MAARIKPFKGLGRVQGTIRRAKAGAQNTTHNFTNKKADSANLDERSTRFGSLPDKEPFTNTRFENRYTGAAVGYLGGVAVGTGAGAAVGRVAHPDSKKFKETVGKSRAHLITDVGTKAGRYSLKRWPEFPTKSVVGGAAVGGALGFGGAYEAKKGQAKYVQQQKKKKPPAVVAKREQKIKLDPPKGARLGYKDEGARSRSIQTARANYKFKGPHGAENKRIMGRATGTGAAIGTSVGAGLGAIAAGRPGAKAGAVFGAAEGTLFGAATGSIRRSARAQKRTINEGYKNGDLVQPKKNQKTNMRGVVVNKSNLSAFGIEH